MGLIDKWLYGVDLEAEQRRQDDLDRRLAEENERDLREGRISPQVYTEAETNRLNSKINVQQEVDEAFAEGWEEGRQNFTGAFNKVSWSILKTIPLSVWIIAAFVLFVWMGGLKRLQGALNK